MRNTTRKLFHAMQVRLAELNSVEGYTAGNSLNFSVEPSVEQTLESKVQESADFLMDINVVGVQDIKGQKVGMEASSTIASRTDTSSADRQTQDPTGLDSNDYECAKTDFDTHLGYLKLDQWAKFPDFQTRWQNAIIQQIARDRMMIGFNGVSRAATTDRATYPLLEDVNIGWLQKIRANDSGSRHIDGYELNGVGNLKNIDALVLDMINSFLDPWFRTSTDLVVLAGRSIVADKYVALTNDNEAPTERAALQTLIQNKQLGGVPTEMVPFFPDNAIAVGLKSALSIYWQEGSRRRTVVDNPKRDRVEDYQSVNEDYVIEDFGAFCFVENITTAAS